VGPGEPWERILTGPGMNFFLKIPVGKDPGNLQVHRAQPYLHNEVGNCICVCCTVGCNSSNDDLSADDGTFKIPKPVQIWASVMDDNLT